ncbi:MAG: hypothetical protein AAFY71_11375 [Bacteroidota bacterium]
MKKLNQISLHTIILLFLACQATLLFGQNIHVDAIRQPLGDVLNQLNQDYNVQFSSEESLIESCDVTIRAKFSDLDEALGVILSGCELTFEKFGNIYVIIPHQPRPVYVKLLKGRLFDRESGDPLPYAVVETPEACILSDKAGRFHLSTSLESLDIHIRHLAYEPIDTVLRIGKDHTILLDQKDICLEEVVINDEPPHALESMPIVQAIRNAQLRKGFYTSFEEFVENSPSLQNNGEHRFSESMQRWIVDGPVTVSRFSEITRREGKEYGRVWGYCDGQDVYFNLGKRVGPTTNFVRMRMYFPYFFYYGIEDNTLYLPTAGIPMSQKKEYILPLEDGEPEVLTRWRLKKILQDDPELLEAFKLEKGKRRKFREYLMKYSGDWYVE